MDFLLPSSTRSLTVGFSRDAINGIYTDGFRSGYRVELYGELTETVYVALGYKLDPWSNDEQLTNELRARAAFSSEADAHAYVAAHQDCWIGDRACMVVAMKVDEKIA